MSTPPTVGARRPLGRTGIDIAPLVFGANVFGWTADAATSFSLLDRFVDAGLNAIDTADVYSAWVPGHTGGESETIIGQWLKARPSRRDDTVIITKVGAPAGTLPSGLSASHIVAAADASLRRLQTDRIDVYFSHYPDAKTPVDETLRAHETLLKQGKVRAIGASNHSAEQLRAALDIAGEHGLPAYQVVQPAYNLVDRNSFEGPLRDLSVSEGLGVITYYGLASGFLSGKYRSAADLAQSVRGGAVKKYLDARGLRILDALDAVAARHGAQPAEVALAWLITREGVTAPIASATTLDQLEGLIRATRLSLSAGDLSALDRASAPA